MDAWAEGTAVTPFGSARIVAIPARINQSGRCQCLALVHSLLSNGAGLARQLARRCPLPRCETLWCLGAINIPGLSSWVVHEIAVEPLMIHACSEAYVFDLSCHCRLEVVPSRCQLQMAGCL